MHAYATDATDRKVIPTILAVISVGLAIALSRTLEALGYQPPWYVDTPSVMGFYGLLYFWFDKVGWKWGIKSGSVLTDSGSPRYLEGYTEIVLQRPFG